jgi:glutaconate CoA-transferase, subunit A
LRVTEKIIGLADVAREVNDGDVVYIHGFGLSAKPMAIIHELIRAQKRDLTVITCFGDIDTDMLCASGVASKVMYCYVSMWYYGLAPSFRRMAENGDVEAEEYSGILIDKMVEAGIQGLPFLPFRGPFSDLLDTEHGKRNFASTTCPFTGEPVLTARALYPDVAIMHAPRSDARGNVQYDECWYGHTKMARKTIVSVEEVVSYDAIRANPTSTVILGSYVDFVVEAPFGAHPTYMPDNYAIDGWQFYDYAQRAATAEGAQDYLQEFVYSVATHGDYLAKIGIKRLLTLQKLQRERRELVGNEHYDAGASLTSAGHAPALS